MIHQPSLLSGLFVARLQIRAASIFKPAEAYRRISNRTPCRNNIETPGRPCSEAGIVHSRRDEARSRSAKRPGIAFDGPDFDGRGW